MAAFDLYRYQLLPTSQQQQELFQKTYSADEIRLHKNQFFENALKSELRFSHRNFEINYKIEIYEKLWFIIKIGAHKKVNRDTKEFTKEKLDSWPNVTVVVHNDPKTQIIAISKNIKAFSNTKIVAQIFDIALTEALHSYGLIIQTREQFEKNNFWSVINENPNKIERVRFEMIAPNMANISHALKIDLKQLNRDTNCHKAKIELESLPGTTLEINKDNELINGCVDYSANGGGDIAIKIIGIRKEVRTSKTVKSVKIDELEIKNPTLDLLERILK